MTCFFIFFSFFFSYTRITYNLSKFRRNTLTVYYDNNIRTFVINSRKKIPRIQSQTTNHMNFREKNNVICVCIDKKLYEHSVIYIYIYRIPEYHNKIHSTSPAPPQCILFNRRFGRVKRHTIFQYNNTLHVYKYTRIDQNISKLSCAYNAISYIYIRPRHNRQTTTNVHYYTVHVKHKPISTAYIICTLQCRLHIYVIMATLYKLRVFIPIFGL